MLKEAFINCVTAYQESPGPARHLEGETLGFSDACITWVERFGVLGGLAFLFGYTQEGLGQTNAQAAWMMVRHFADGLLMMLKFPPLLGNAGDWSVTERDITAHADGSWEGETRYRGGHTETSSSKGTSGSK